MLTKGKFLLMPINEFVSWLKETKFSRPIKIIQNHHTYKPDYTHFNGTNHFKLLSGMEQYHIQHNGFSEIAQNITTFPDGQVAICRSLDKIPAGIKGANLYGICIEHLGNFDVGGDTMTQAHRQTILQVNALLCNRFNLVPNDQTIVYHHWYDLITGQRRNGLGVTKTCPGETFFKGNSLQAARNFFIPQVNSTLIALLGEPTRVPAPDDLLGSMRQVMVKASVLNVRSQPDTKGKVVKKLQQGVMVPVYEEAGDWYRINGEAQQWVNRKFVVVQPKPAKPV